MNVVEFENVTFTYDASTSALDGMSLHIGEGEFVCILGGNGSGKSTLAKHVNALLVPDEGCVRVLERDTRDEQNLYFVRSNAGMVFQNPDDQIVASVIEDDIAFGPENLGVPTEELRELVSNALEQVGLQGFEKHQTSALSGGQKQRVAIAGILAMKPRILILDEASAMLDPRGRKGLLRICRQLNEQGLAIVLITHFMEEAAHADRVIVLDRGRVAIEGTPKEVFTQVELLAKLHLDVPYAASMCLELRKRGVDISTFADLDDLERELIGKLDQPDENAGSYAIGQAKQAAHEPRETAEAPVVLKLDSVSYTYQPSAQGSKKRKRKDGRADAGQAAWGNDPGELWALRDVSLDVFQGEFLGIAGHTGSGKSTLIQLASGLLNPTKGKVLAKSVDLSNKRAAHAARHDIGVVFQYPERQLFAATVYDDVAFGPRNLGLNASCVEERVRDALTRVHLDFDDVRDKSPFALSGGQQRRVAIAGVIAMRPETLILDEPTAGLDPYAHESLLNLVRELQQRDGLTIVMVSHNMDDLARLCDRIAVLNQGRLVRIASPLSIFDDQAFLHDIGLDIPHSAHLSKALGITLQNATRLPSESELADAIAQRLRHSIPAPICDEGRA